jgi:hypothetical protein
MKEPSAKKPTPQAPHGNIKNPIRQIILDLAEFTIADLVHRSGFNPNSIRTEINRLLKAGFISASADVSSENYKVGRPSAIYKITSEGREKLIANNNVQDVSAPLYDIANAAKILKRFYLQDIVRITKYKDDICRETLRKLEEDGWLKSHKNGLFEVPPDADGVIFHPKVINEIEKAINVPDDLILDNEYYLSANQLLQELEGGEYEKKEKVIEETNKCLRYARQELGVSLGDGSVQAAYIDEILVRTLILDRQYDLARKVSIRVLMTFLENSLVDDARKLVSTLNVYSDVSNDDILPASQKLAQAMYAIPVETVQLFGGNAIRTESEYLEVSPEIRSIITNSEERDMRSLIFGRYASRDIR